MKEYRITSTMEHRIYANNITEAHDEFWRRIKNDAATEIETNLQIEPLRTLPKEEEDWAYGLMLIEALSRVNNLTP